MARTPAQVKRFIREQIALFPLANFANKGMMGAAIGVLNKCCGSEGRRHVLLKYLFGIPSSKNLTGADWIALLRWINITRIGEEYYPQEELQKEINAILADATGVEFGLLPMDIPQEDQEVEEQVNQKEDPKKDYYDF